MEALTFVPSHVPLQHSSSSSSSSHSFNKSNLVVKKKKGHCHFSVVSSSTDRTVEVSEKPSSVNTTTQENPLKKSSLSSSSSSVPPLMKVSPESLQYESGFLGSIPSKQGIDELLGEDSPDSMSYLTNILSSKVYDVAIESPLQYAKKLSERIGVNVWLKREDLQPVFSFKLRGAYNMMAKLSEDQLARGVICSSAGNHAQGVALAAQRLGCDAVIVMPVTTPEIKWKSVKRLGAKVVLVGDSYDEAQAYAKQQGEQEGRTFIPPFDHPDVIMGQGTVGMEIVRQAEEPLHAIFVPVGGGGLIAGIAAYVKLVCPEVKIIGVEPSDANAMALSLHHGERIMLDQVGGFADGVAVKVVGEETFRLCRELIDGVVLVSRDAICASIKDMFEEKRSILEPAGALALAGAEAYCKYYGLKSENVVAVTSGANMNFDRLRLVTELADVGRKREAVLATYMLEETGSFKQFCELIGPMNITEFKYRYDTTKNEALVLYSVGLHTVSELTAMVNRMESCQLRTINLTTNDLVKDHLRHLMGGRSNVQDELICRFVFPERPGALVKFLDTFSPRWNISLFHYRAQGETGANVLVGIQVPSSEMYEFRVCVDNLGYEYTDEMSNAAFRLLMQ
ncbi:threonine dehydratase biosynthetic, chloroplastic-like [Papaver somniferum]|uniref:threonine dehydratase biosynthetic, chloroplastic-like n=1 Tax=Papaver somniferum TaxID=3469 RepID=UPI000E6F7A50|nr:threonine dehydratase biosynthetic, chloroplastic-like [Papaver somniferum]